MHAQNRVILVAPRMPEWPVCAMLCGLIFCLIALPAAAEAPFGPEPTAISIAELVSQATEDRQLGQHRLALERLLMAREQARVSGLEQLDARLAAPIAQAYLYLGQPQKAGDEFTQALARATQDNDVQLVAGIENDLGQLAAREGRLDDAQRYFLASLSRSASTSAPLAAIQTQLNLAQLALRRDLPEQAAQRLVEAESGLASISASRAKLHALLRAATLAQQLKTSAGDTARWIELADELAARLNDPRGQATAQALRGQRSAAQGDLEQGLLATRRAISIAQSVQAPDLSYRLHAQAGRLLAALGRRDAAIAAYQRAAVILRSIEVDLMAESLIGGESYRELVGPVYQQLGDLLLQRAASQPATQAGDLQLARDVIERLRTVELQDYFQDQCIAESGQPGQSATAAMANVAVLYPVLLADRVELIVTLPDGLRQIILPVSAARLTEEARKLRQLLEKRTTREYLASARQLYDWLIRPLEGELSRQSIDTLAVVPDGALRNIPFAALHDGAHFLIDRYGLVVAPAVNLVELAPSGGTSKATLLSGITQARDSFPALPFAAAELDGLSQHLDGKLLKDGQFQLAMFANEVRDAPYGIVHIASHGQIEANPRHSFVLAHDGRLTLDKLEELVKFSRLGAGVLDLVMLSACHTAVGDDRAALGLAGMAVKAGARSAVATLWYVNDEAASALVSAFYDELGKGAPKAAALRNAQRRLLAEPRFQHPLYWAPFILVGNWQ